MASENSATLTEQALFNEFAEGEVITRTRTGKEKSRHPVEHMFMGLGETEDFSEVMPGILADLRNDPDPTYGLSVTIDTLRGIVTDLTIVHDEFQRMKAQRLIETGCNELEQNKRYRAHRIGGLN
jgi:hypothetical protein